MAVPKQRKTKSRRNQRRSHIFLKKLNLVACQKCGHLVLPHTVCPNCGFYNGREVIDVMKKLTRKERKEKEKELTGSKESERASKPLTMEELSKK